MNRMHAKARILRKKCIFLRAPFVNVTREKEGFSIDVDDRLWADSPEWSDIWISEFSKGNKQGM